MLFLNSWVHDINLCPDLPWENVAIKTCEKELLDIMN